MKSAKSLNRQLVASMAGVTGLALIIMCAGSILFYEFIYFRFWAPEGLEGISEPDSIWPTTPEWTAYLVLWAIGMGGAIIAAIRFARRLIQPLEAVATAARRVAAGDLSARAAPTKASFAETRQLIEDFNHMAGQLDRAETEMRAWHAAIAHELRTPLTILRGQIQGYVDGVFIPDTPSLQGLLVQVEGLSRIVDDLKVLTLAQNGRLELRLETIDLAQEVASVVAVTTPMLRMAGVSVHVDLGSVVIRGDGARIRQTLTALLDNVRRYAAPCEVRIENPCDARPCHSAGLRSRPRLAEGDGDSGLRRLLAERRVPFAGERRQWSGVGGGAGHRAGPWRRRGRHGVGAPGRDVRNPLAKALTINPQACCPAIGRSDVG